MKVLAPVVLLLVGAGFLFDKETHWVFAPLNRPAGKDVDFFVHKQLKATKLTPSPTAEPRRLLRRLYLDLIGLHNETSRPHATILHLLSLNHKHLTYRHQGHDYRISDVHGRIICEILA